MRIAEQVKRDIVAQLAWDARVDATDVTVEVEAGTVKLGGTVPNLTARLAAADDAWQVPEVREVDNAILVAPPSVDLVPRDEELARNARVALDLNSAIPSDDLSVSVASGVVTLKGSVDALWKKHVAENLVSSLLGVVGVENKLGIAPTRKPVDEELARDIIEAIDRRVLVDKKDVEVVVNNGVVTLSGSVPGWAARRAAFDAALYTAGVRDIRNNLVITPD